MYRLTDKETYIKIDRQADLSMYIWIDRYEQMDRLVDRETDVRMIRQRDRWMEIRVER
jgi:hypothetical protein